MPSRRSTASTQVLAPKALLDLGLDLETIANSRANLNAQEIGDPEKRAQQWQRVTRKDPIFDTAETRRLVEEGVSKLLSMQNDDGGWGWFYGYGSYSTPRLTALITRGLYVAQSCDYEVDQAALERGRQWLINYEREETLKVIRGMVWSDEEKSVRSAAGKWKNRADDTDAFVYYALAETGLNPVAFQKDFVDYDAADFGESAKGDPSAVHAVMKELLWRAHTDLELYALATYGLALTREEAMDENAKARFETILRAFKEYRTVDEENQTVWLDLNKRRYWAWWSWFGSEFETQGYYLRLLNRADRAILTELGLENDAPMLVKYLLNNRKNATYWNSTRDTATCLEALRNTSFRRMSSTQPEGLIKIDGVEVMSSTRRKRSLRPTALITRLSNSSIRASIRSPGRSKGTDPSTATRTTSTSRLKTRSKRPGLKSERRATTIGSRRRKTRRRSLKADTVRRSDSRSTSMIENCSNRATSSSRAISSKSRS